MLQVHQIRFYRHELRTRFPFRYGIASMTEVPYLFVQAEVTFAGATSVGLSADLLPPKWFTKDPASDYVSEDLPQMLATISNAAEVAVDVGQQPSFFDWWLRLYEHQSAWGTHHAIAPLLANFGVSLIERAVLDAACRAVNMPVHRFLRENRAQIEFARVRPELRDVSPTDVIVRTPAARILVRHTIGISDPLTPADISEGDRVDDGLPHSLTANLRTYDLRYFKIKLSGDRNFDHERLSAIRQVIASEIEEEVYFTLDGNENFPDVEEFREQYLSHLADPELKGFLERGLLFVEQPLHREQALKESVRRTLENWKTAPPLIIDESDADLGSLPEALRLGYSGTSHKNCKGVIKGLLNAATIGQKRKSNPQLILSGEDLANLGPVALLQDLAIASALGISHVERNGHHYFAGISGFPSEIQNSTFQSHGDLYQRTAGGLVSLGIKDGSLRLGSVLAAPFGYGQPPPLSELCALSPAELRAAV